MLKPTLTSQIHDKIFKILEKNPEGVSWAELLRKINEKGEFHPKTVNGYVWKLVEKYPDKVYKPEKRLFRLLKYKK